MAAVRCSDQSSHAAAAPCLNGWLARSPAAVYALKSHPDPCVYKSEEAEVNTEFEHLRLMVIADSATHVAAVRCLEGLCAYFAERSQPPLYATTFNVLHNPVIIAKT